MDDDDDDDNDDDRLIIIILLIVPKQANSASKTTPVAAPLPPKPQLPQPQPAVMAPTSELPPAYTQSAAQPVSILHKFNLMGGSHLYWIRWCKPIYV